MRLTTRFVQTRAISFAPFSLLVVGSVGLAIGKVMNHYDFIKLRLLMEPNGTS